MAKIETQFANIFIHFYSQKSASTCKLFKSEPTKNQEDKLGSLFGILEINTPSKENAQIITQLISYLEDYYYDNLENKKADIETAFESALNEVNQKFIQLVQDKKIHLVGNLNEYTIKEKINLVVGVIKDNKLYLSYLNNIGIFLIHKTKQDYKLIDIKKNSEDDEANEDSDKIFQNLIQGEVNAPDFLVLANSSFLNYVSLERIKKTITSLPIHKAAEYFKNSLLKFEGNNFASIIIKNTNGETETVKEPPSLTSITELNSTEFSTEELLAPSFWNKIKASSIRVISRISILIKKDGQPIEELEEIEGEIIEPTDTITKSDTAKNILSPEQTLDKNSVLVFKKYSSKVLGILHSLFIKLKKLIKSLLSKSSVFTEKLPKLKNYLRLKLSFSGNYLKKIPNLSKILLIVAILLIIIFVYSTSYFKHKQTKVADSQEYQNLINEIEQKKNEADSTIIFGDEDKARDIITDAQSLLNTLPVESQKQKDKHQELNIAIEQVIAKLRHITIIEEPILIADLATEQENNIDIKNIILDNNTLISFDSLSNNTYQTDLETRETEKIYSNLSDIGTIVKTKQIEDKLLIYHNKNGFIEYKDKKFIPIDISLPVNSKITGYATYFNRLYTLDSNSQQIYRHPKGEINGYTSGNSWVKEDDLDLSNVVAMGIDTNIWLLKKDGQIFKLNKGYKTYFEIKNLEPVLSEPSNLFTNDETNYLYILEPKNRRIVILDKEGNLVNQYYSEKFDNLKDFAIVEKEKKMFIVNDNKIYFFNLEDI
ncbi:hypothetical protein ACFL2U_02965 [Patescibacteria group bacterium]